jgi:hypothetical protein
VTWQIPHDLDALYVELPWLCGAVLCVHRTGVAPTGDRLYDLDESKVGGVLYALERASDDEKAVLFSNMVKHGIVSPVAARPKFDPAEKDFCDALRSHDWTHEMSDDPSNARRGREELHRIRSMLVGRKDRQALFDAYKDHVWKRTPKPEMPA